MRKDNLLKMAQIFEDLSGDVDQLVDMSPISLLIDRIVEMSRPQIMKTISLQDPTKKKSSAIKKAKDQTPSLSKEETRFIRL